ncbi:MULTISPECIES: hypothetical protein [Sphingomonas]|uniref:Uncharacterized protein n=1 Tax=Sphingomonas adhaesiva TaxID=28212 RepID=A0A2A4I5X7_9SPHN|nr:MULTISPECIES: hypothetical protein [Sphingomonas]PCG13895.1 hypothetical protein COA07_11255 [Sphingomonas adhaesiva]PZU76734.1 MAG: hypothetical protein DI530_13620 [Sphingomonas sp.]
MALVEVIEDEDATQPLFVAEFDFLPRVGEHLARDTEGYFQYYNIIKIWHRRTRRTEPSERASLLHSTINHAEFVHAA